MDFSLKWRAVLDLALFRCLAYILKSVLKILSRIVKMFKVFIYCELLSEQFDSEFKI